MTIDRRKDERANFHMNDCDGSFMVHDINDNQVEVVNVNDVSISGIGLQLRQTSFDEGDKIKLTYETDGIRVTIFATIRWYSYISPTEGCRIGIQFEPGQGDMNLFFYMALREYLDSFDHETFKEQIAP